MKFKYDKYAFGIILGVFFANLNLLSFPTRSSRSPRNPRLDRSPGSRGPDRLNQKKVAQAPRPNKPSAKMISPFACAELEAIKQCVCKDPLPPALHPNAPLESFLHYCAGNDPAKRAQVLRALIEYNRKKIN